MPEENDRTCGQECAGKRILRSHSSHRVNKSEVAEETYTPQAVIALNMYYKYAKPEGRMTEKRIVFHKSRSLKS